MGIGSVTSSNSMSAMQIQMVAANAPDAKSKKIQDEITDVEREIQKISSDADLSYTEKTDERKTLQKEISGLNIKLDQRQEELLRAQKRENLQAELREDKSPEKEDDAEDDLRTKALSSDSAAETSKAAAADESRTRSQGSVIADTDDGTVILKEEAGPNETQGIVSEKEQAAETEDDDDEKTRAADSDTDTNATLSSEEVRAMVSADTSAQLASRQGTIVAKTEDGIAILKGEITQDERRGVNTERKQAELEKMEKQEERAVAFQFSALGKAMNAKSPAAETNVTGIEETAQDDTENNAYTTTIRASREEQAMQQQFQVSIA